MNEYDLEKVLATRIDDFIQDFDFADIQRDLQLANVLSLPDLHSIRLQPTEKEKIERLFFLLVIKNTNFSDFLSVLQKKYAWLANDIERALRDPNVISIRGEDPYNEEIITLRKVLPKYVDFNVHRCTFLWETRQKLLTLNRHQHLVVHGSLAFGKRWIVMDALCSYQVMHRMDGKVFWINCSKCKTPECILQRMEQLYILSNPHHDVTLTTNNPKGIANKILTYKETLRQIFKKGSLRDGLVVLIDVQNYETVRAFEFNCKTLITTRYKKLLDQISNASHKIEINSGFTREESLELFSKVLGQSINTLPEAASDLHRLCKKNPFFISLIAINLKRYSSDILRWNHWKKTLEKHESTSYKEFRKPIVESLNNLKAEYKEWFKSLVIFTDNVNIPMKVLRLYWNLNKSEVEAIVERLDGLYLLQTVQNDGEVYCSLHYLYYSYLAHHIDAATKKDMHRKLVNSYRITEALQNRLEPNIAGLPNDEYFHYYIGYHLKESGMRSMFPMLYFDFGFLEQKLRYSGLPNTLGDFTTYRNEIAGTDRIELLDELTDFLAYIEEILLKSEDTCLLQYALTKDNLIREEALQQAQRFTNRIWFSDIDHSVKYRQIVKLPAQPKLVHFIEPNTSLIALPDNKILLTDMSYEYTVESTIYLGHNSPIRDMQLFRRNYFVSLDNEGTVNVWSLKETEIERRRASRGDEATNVGARQNIPMRNACNLNNKGQQLQSFDKGANAITCLLLLDNTDVTQRGEACVGELHMFAATKNGRILVYLWNDDRAKFELREEYSFDTRNENIAKMIAIRQILITINSTGRTSFRNLIDHSEMARTLTLDQFPHEPPISVYHMQRSSENRLTIAVIYSSCIYQIKIRQFGQMIIPEIVSEYKPIGEQNFITCSSITDNKNYLMLGTKKGIIVLDPKTNREILRSSISDNVACIDVCSVDHPQCKFVLVSAMKKGGSVVYVHGINFENNFMQWTTNKNGSPFNGRDTMVAWLMGGKTFDVCQMNYDCKDINGNGHCDDDDDDYNDDNFTLVAADWKSHVHTKHSTDNFSRTISVEAFESDVTNVSIGKSKKFVSCENGCVFEIGRQQELIKFDSTIDYLKYYEQFDILIASTTQQYKILTPHKEFECASRLIKNTFVYMNQFVILLKEDCSFEILNTNTNVLTQNAIDNDMGWVFCSDILDDTIAVGILHTIRIYRIHLEQSDSNPTITRLLYVEANTNFALTSICITKTDSLLLAVGYQNGTIELYDVLPADAQLLQKLQSHKAAVNALKFSPWHLGSMNGVPPIVLVSSSEEICFWNITHTINNPIDRTANLRLSQRFNRKNNKSASPTMANSSSNDHNTSIGNIYANGSNTLTDNTLCQPYLLNGMNENGNIIVTNGGSGGSTQHNKTKGTAGPTSSLNPWIGKCGASNKPELLSCTKFVGSSAEKIYANRRFTKFILIDNEGEIYYLKVSNLISGENS